MSSVNPNMDGVIPNKRSRPPVGDGGPEPEEQDLDEVESGLEDEAEADGESDLPPSLEDDEQKWNEPEAPEEGTSMSARFEDVKVGLRKTSTGRYVIGVDIDLAIDTSQEGEPEEQELRLGSEEVEAMLERAPRAAAPMAAPAGRAALAGARKPAPGLKLKFDRKKFFRAYAAAFQKLDRRQMQSLHALLTAAEADPMLTDIRWLAYMLATVQHECAGTWRPIEEYGKGKGRPYGRPVVVTDPQGKKYRNVYYGRGYVQLTWKSNYQKMGKLLKNRLLYNPSLALQPAVAYKILSLGMRQGIFTGKKLGNYIHGSRADYVNARRIINGLDRARKIAQNAAKLEKVLRRSAVRAGRPSPR